MTKFALLVFQLASTAYGGIIYTRTDCGPSDGCTTVQSFSNFGPRTTLSESLSSNLTSIYPGLLPPGFEASETQTLNVTFLTAGPARPGYLDLTYSGLADGMGTSSYYANGAVSGLFGWNCFGGGCSGTGHAFVPITLGDQIQIGISVGSIVGNHGPFFPGDPVYHGYGGFGVTSYTLQVREGSTTGPVVAITDVPEPAGYTVLGMLILVTAGLWSKRTR